MRTPFKIGDVVYLVHMEEVVKLENKGDVEIANTTSENGIRLATQYEIQEGF